MTGNDLLMQFQADVLGVPVDPPEGDRDDRARRRLRRRPGHRLLGDQDELRERWAEDKRWEPQMDEDDARAAVRALEEGRAADARLGRVTVSASAPGSARGLRSGSVARRRRRASGAIGGRRTGCAPRRSRSGPCVSWNSSTRPRAVSDAAKPGPPWTRTVPSSSRALRSAIAAARSPRRSRPVPNSCLEGVREDGLRLLVHRRRDRPIGRRPVRTHDLVAAAAHRVDAGLLERAQVPLTRVVAEPLEHPLVGPVGAGREPVEGQDHLENHFSIAHVGKDVAAAVNSSPPVPALRWQ